MPDQDATQLLRENPHEIGHLSIQAFDTLPWFSLLTGIRYCTGIIDMNTSRAAKIGRIQGVHIASSIP